MKVMTIIGTRPEAIKMAPLIRAIAATPQLESILCSTGQHKEMLDQVTAFFDLTIDINLNIMQGKQDLFDILSTSLLRLRDAIRQASPDYILVHGDTSTCLAGALAAFYSKIPVGHVEAGLRTYNLQAPYPEEANRCLVSKLANLHFCPTKLSMNNLQLEGIHEKSILVTGNTVIDALLIGRQIIQEKYTPEHWRNTLGERLSETLLDNNKKMVLITAHRRENIGSGFENICNAIKELSSIYKDVEFVYPVHLNPQIKDVAQKILGDSPKIHLIQPQSYATFIWLMDRAHIILTDSGGIQEEAPSLNKPVLVLRDVTERPEALEAGTIRLVGTDKPTIIKEFCKIMDDTTEYQRMACAENPFGDGTASQKIVSRLLAIKAEL
jgi:UDP-N-acetylglucosamine 2-epimerase (non-hydrolysing)